MPEETQTNPPAADPEQQSLTETDRTVQAVDHEEPSRLAFPVVGIGASAGGLEAFTEFFKAMPADSGMAFVLVQHLPPDRESLIAEILARHTNMPVHQVQQGMAVTPNTVYVIRPGKTLTIKDGHLHLGQRLEKPGNNRPVDDFFKSLAEEQRQKSICIILSGMGSNGTAGAQAIKAVGGLCIAQELTTAQFPSMPQHLIDAGYADYILQVQEMPGVLLEYVKQPYISGEDVRISNDQQHLREILAILRTRARHDFSGYKKPTILRRIQRRMGLNHVGTLSEYARLLWQSSTEVTSLSDDLLIHVTGFFRDTGAWESLRINVIVPLVASREPHSQVRCWVTACSSGEEAYTLAMLLMEETERAHKPLDIKVFATDTAERTLANARGGLYPGGIEAEITPQRLERFFHREDSVYRVRPELRQTVVFAPQNILQDPPFSRLDIASCRNLLIYLEPPVQSRLLSILHFGLRQGGALFLGSSETAGESGDLFEVIDKKSRIYRRVGPTRHGLVDFPLPHALTTPSDSPRPGLRPSMGQLTNAALLARHVPAAVTVDRDFRIVYYHGNTRPYFEQPTGEPSRDILTIAIEPIRPVIRTALQRAMSENAAVTLVDGWIDEGPDRKRVVVTASPLDVKAISNYFVVSFDHWPEPAIKPVLIDRSGTANTELLDELQRTRDELQSTIEELQTSNEEHKASSEEVMSMNEEMQSTNEELETSREEMQSLNEELTTVNAQLQAKAEEYQAINSDLSSLLRSTDIAVLFLDPRSCIRRFTPALKDLIDLINTDIGRPLSDLAWKFSDPDLMNETQAVMEKLVPREKEILADSGRWYLRRVLPYRTADNRIDGLVITFVDISERKRMESSLGERARLLDLSNDVIIVRDIRNRIIYWNHGATDLYGWTADEAYGKDIFKLLHIKFEPPQEQLVSKLRSQERLIGEVVHQARDGREITALCRWTLDQDADGNPVAILMTATDITERKQAEAAVRQSEQQFRMLVEAVRDFAIFMTDPHGKITTWNPAAERLLGWTEAEAVGNFSAMIFTLEDRDAGKPQEEIELAMRTGRAADERWHVTRQGRRFWGSGVLGAVGEPGEKIRGFVKILRDETARKQSEDAMMEAKRAAEVANRMKDEFLATLSHELRTPLSAILLWTKLLHSEQMSPRQLSEGLSAIKNSAESQKSLIDDLLDTSRIMSGKLRLHLQAVEMMPLVQEAIDAIMPAAQGKGIEFNAELDTSVGVVMIDADRIRQVVWNLLTNAVKFSETGSRVVVRLSRKKSLVEITVSDTGRGIAAEFLPHVFDRFRQADASSTRRHGGLGLGLDISKQLVELHGGTIDVQSAGVNQGSTFTVHLPLREVTAKRKTSAKPPQAKTNGPVMKDSLNGVKILLIEDEPETRRALTILLNQSDATVTAVGSAQEGFESYQRQTPDLIISDIGLPDEDGCSLMTRIRDLEKTTSSAVPAVALSAFTRDEDRLRALQSGFQRHLAKPIDSEHLIDTLEAILNRN